VVLPGFELLPLGLCPHVVCPLFFECFFIMGFLAYQSLGADLFVSWVSSSAGSSCSLGTSRVQSEWAVTGFFHLGPVGGFLGFFVTKIHSSGASITSSISSGAGPGVLSSVPSCSLGLSRVHSGAGSLILALRMICAFFRVLLFGWLSFRLFVVVLGCVLLVNVFSRFLLSVILFIFVGIFHWKFLYLLGFFQFLHFECVHHHFLCILAKCRSSRE
jgi:hypothetical protein